MYNSNIYKLLESLTEATGVSIHTNVPTSESRSDIPRQITTDHGLHNPILYVNKKSYNY